MSDKITAHCILLLKDGEKKIEKTFSMERDAEVWIAKMWNNPQCKCAYWDGFAVANAWNYERINA